MFQRKYGLIALIAASVLVITGCSAALPGQEPTTTPEAEAETGAPAAQQQSVVSATGEVIPALYSTLAFSTGGTVEELLVEVGDEIEAGDVIARLGTTDLEAALAVAEANLAQAEANLRQAEAGPSEEQIQAAERSLAAANANIGAAVANRDALFSAITDDLIIEAENQVFEAREQYNDLQQSMEDLLAFVDTIDLSEIDPGDPNPLQSGESLAYQIELAALNLATAQSQLEDLLDGPDPEQVAIANAQINLASAQAEAARARLALLEAQPLEEEIAVAEAEVEQARTGVMEAEANLEQAVLRAPFGGTVVDLFIDESEFVGPGQEIIQMGDLTGLRIETTDLNEIDVAGIDVGDEVLITFDALPGVEVDGEVTRIAPKNQPGTGVNYNVIIEMTDPPDEVRWGMTAFVDIFVGDEE